MPRFRYEAAAPGEAGTVRGRMEAPHKRAVVERLQAEGTVPIHIEEVGVGVASLQIEEIFYRPLGPRVLAVLTGQLAALLAAGLPLDEGLDILEELAEGRRGREAMRAVADAIRRGSTFSDALESRPRDFPAFYASMVRAGESGGNLEATLERLAAFLERTEASREYVRSALIYPALVAVTCCGSIAVLFAFVVPRFRPLFEQAGPHLPSAARTLLAISDAVRDYGWLGLALFASAVLLALRAWRDPARRVRRDQWVLEAPLIGDLATKVEAGRLCRTLGTLLRNGVSLIPALRIARETIGNTALRKAVDAIRAEAETGKGLAAPMRATGVFPTILVHLVRVGEESGRQDEMMLRAADFLETEARRAIDRLLALLTPALTIVLGLIVAAVIGSILTAVLSVYELTI